MQKDLMIQTLRDAGLSEIEANVYYAALGQGPTTVLALSRVVEGVKRTTIYNIIESLIKKGLMSVNTDGLKKKYIAEHPAKLEAILEERRSKFHELLPQFSALFTFTDREGGIEHYKGIESVKSLYREFVQTLKPDEFYYVISDVEKWYEQDTKFFTWYIKKRRERVQQMKIILPNTPEAQTWVKTERSEQEARLVHAPDGIDVAILMTPNYFIIHQLVYPVNAIVIRNPAVIATQKFMFEIMWGAL